tara:strand:- start:12447 stop:12800 length:354 start_codon:yes stop_codon:yes gene_type:complete
MDERLEKALNFSNYMVTLNNQKRVLKEKFREQTIYYFLGAQFTVTKELITFVSMLVEQGNDEDIVLVDDNDTPIMVKDLTEFQSEILNTYFTAANEYHAEFEKLRKNRSVEKLVDHE